MTMLLHCGIRTLSSLYGRCSRIESSPGTFSAIFIGEGHFQIVTRRNFRKQYMQPISFTATLKRRQSVPTRKGRERHRGICGGGLETWVVCSAPLLLVWFRSEVSQ